MGFLNLFKLALGSVLVYNAITTYSVPVSQLERVKGELTYLLTNIDSIAPNTNDATKTMLNFYHRLLTLMEDMNDLQKGIVLNDVLSLTTENEIKWTMGEDGHERSRRGVGDEYPAGESKCTSDGDDCTKLLTPYCMGQCLLCPPGPAGPPGPPGATGATGSPGPVGRDGRDALNLRTEPQDGQEALKLSSSLPINQYNPNKAGALYVRWGRRECPSTSDMVYKGIAVGASFNQKGSGSNYLCLPDEPIYYQPDTISTYRGRIYAAEYETLNFGTYANIHQRDVPCVVCMARQRSSLLLMPARNVCPNSTWTLEYSGHIMSASQNHYRSEYVCIDLNAEAVEGNSGNDNGALFYPVEGKCLGGLPCGPYVDGYELTCAVCTI